MSTNYGDIFWKGYDRGHAAVSQFDDARRKGLARKGMRELDNETTADPNAAQADAYARENAAMAAQDNETFGTQAAPEDYQYGTPQLTEARGLGDAERYRRAETIYRDQGFDDKAEQYGERSRRATREEKEDVRTARRDAMAEQTHGLQTRGMERDENKAVKLEAFNVDFAAYQADVADKKKSFNIAELYTMAQKHGVPVDEVNKLAMNQMGVDEKVATARVQERLRELGEAAGKGLPAMLELADPDPNDNILPSEVKNKDGTTSIMYGDKEMYKLPPAAPGISVAGMLYQEIKGTLEGNPIAAGIQFLAIDKARMEVDKGEAQIGLIGAQTRAADANAYESRAKAALTGRTDPNARAGVGGERLTALTGYANSLNSEIANVDRAMLNAAPGSDEYKSLAAQRNRALASLKKVRADIEADRLGGASAPAPAQGGPEVGTVDNGYTFKGGNPADPANWVEAPSSALPRKPSGKPSGKPEAPTLVMSEDEKRNLWADGAASRMLPGGLTRKPDDEKYRKVDPRGAR